MSAKLAVLGLSISLAACNRPIEVGDPFYLWRFEEDSGYSLFRCPDGPVGGCAVDGLPGPGIVAAGADKNYVVVALGSSTGEPKYYYFGRIPDERRGWGANPEKIVGPIDVRAFEAAKARLNLPGFSVRP